MPSTVIFLRYGLARGVVATQASAKPIRGRVNLCNMWSLIRKGREKTFSGTLKLLVSGIRNYWLGHRVRSEKVASVSCLGACGTHIPRAHNRVSGTGARCSGDRPAGSNAAVRTGH